MVILKGFNTEYTILLYCLIYAESFFVAHACSIILQFFLRVVECLLV